MIDIGRIGVLIAGCATLGCSQEKLGPVKPQLSTATAEDLTGQQSSLPGEGPFDMPEIGGRRVDPFGQEEAKAVVLIFVSTVCPIANRYAPELTRLYEAFQPKQVAFWLVYADSSETPEQIRRHRDEYQLHMPAILDPDHRLVRFCHATRTPEAVVFTADRQQRYRGRIDDRFTDYGKSREFASQHDLQDALDAILAGKAVPLPVTDAIGCYIPGVEE